jgi:hypothetical protein
MGAGFGQGKTLTVFRIGRCRSPFSWPSSRFTRHSLFLPRQGLPDLRPYLVPGVDDLEVSGIGKFDQHRIIPLGYRGLLIGSANLGRNDRVPGSNAAGDAEA